MDKIVLKNMSFFGYHGDLQSENELGQRFYADIILHTDVSKAGKSDNLEDSINYVEIYNIAKAVVEGKPCHLIERVATLIADKIWQTYDVLAGLEVTVRKPSVPIAGILDYVEVTVTRGQA